MGIDVDRLLSHASAALVGGGLYLTGDDNLRITTIGALSGAVLAIEGRLVNPEGAAIPFAERHVPSSVYGTVTQLLPIAEGILTHLQVRATTGAALRGHVFALVEVVRGGGSNAQPLGTLLQGYVTATQRLAWPGSPLESSIAGPGRLRAITGTDPAAGVEIAETVPTGTRWRLRSMFTSLTTSAVVANRAVRFVVDDGATIIFATGGNVSQVASTAVNYNVAALGHNLTAIVPVFPLAIPDGLFIPAAGRLRTITGNLDVGDNWNAPQYLVEEWLEG